jgi:broad specificity phosphatase PhoE
MAGAPPVRLTLVRHGRAAAGWDGHHDPGLDETGRAQADALAADIGAAGPIAIVVSPLRRTRETAVPLEARWGVEARVEPAVAEIPSPTDDLAARTAWLRTLMGGTWSDHAPELRGWCDGVVGALLALPSDTVVVTHFVAINVAVGRATDDDRAMCFQPDYCSQTVLEHDGERLSLVALGRDATTTVR